MLQVPQVVVAGVLMVSSVDLSYIYIIRKICVQCLRYTCIYLVIVRCFFTVPNIICMVLKCLSCMPVVRTLI